MAVLCGGVYITQFDCCDIFRQPLFYTEKKKTNFKIHNKNVDKIAFNFVYNNLS